MEVSMDIIPHGAAQQSWSSAKCRHAGSRRGRRPPTHPPPALPPPYCVCQTINGFACHGVLCFVKAASRREERVCVGACVRACVCMCATWSTQAYAHAKKVRQVRVRTHKALHI